MSRSVPSNVTLSSVTSNKTSALSAYTHPAGHTLTFFADATIWDESSNKAVLPQDLNRN